MQERQSQEISVRFQYHRISFVFRNVESVMRQSVCESEGRLLGGTPVLSFIITARISVMAQKIWRVQSPAREAPLCKHFTAFVQSVALLHGAYRGQCPCPGVHGSSCRPCAGRMIKPLLMIRADADTGTNLANILHRRIQAMHPHTEISHNYRI